MSYLCQKCQKIRGNRDFVSEVKRVENYPDFEKAIQHSAWSNGDYS